MALREATDIKRASKTSFAKLGVTDEMFNAAVAGAERADEVVTSRRGPRPTELRQKVLDFVAERGYTSVKDLVKAVMVAYELKYTQAYYLAVMLPKKLAAK